MVETFVEQELQGYHQDPTWVDLAQGQSTSLAVGLARPSGRRLGPLGSPGSHDALVAALRESLECMASDGCERCEAVGTRRWAHFVARGEAARSGFARAVRQAFVRLPLDSEVLVGGAQRLPPPQSLQWVRLRLWWWVYSRVHVRAGGKVGR